MTRRNEDSKGWMTRRDVLAGAALGAAAVAVSPYVGLGQGLAARAKTAVR